MKQESAFCYWTKPWVKWVTLTAGILQIPVLIGKIRDYQQVLHAGIFSPEKLTLYIMQQKFSCMASIICILGFLGIFLIGSFAKSKKASQLAESLLLLGISALLCISLLLWWQAIRLLWLWGIVLCFACGVAVFKLFRLFRSA